jgi:hypothetical protein
LGPRLATGNHAHTTKSARITASITAKSNPNRRPLIPLEDNEDKPTIEDFLNKDSIIQRDRFPEGTCFPGDKNYNKANDLFSNLYGILKPLLLLIPILSQL